MKLPTILVLACLLMLAVGPAFPGEDDEFISLFDGQSLDGWDGDDRFWYVEDGHIVGKTTSEDPLERNTFLIWKGGEPGDFELKFEYRIDTEWANSGIQVRSRRLNGYRVGGYQPDIATDGWITGILFEEAGRGVLARLGQKVTIAEDGEKHVERFAEEDELAERIRSDDWNNYHVIAKGNRLKSRINGVKMHELIDNAPEASSEGIIAIQLHTGPPMTIRLRNIRLKYLEDH